MFTNGSVRAWAHDMREGARILRTRRFWSDFGDFYSPEAVTERISRALVPPQLPLEEALPQLADDECYLYDGVCIRDDARHWRLVVEAQDLDGETHTYFGECEHVHQLAVHAVDGRLVAYLCPHCDHQETVER